MSYPLPSLAFTTLVADLMNVACVVSECTVRATTRQVAELSLVCCIIAASRHHTAGP